MRNYIFLFIFSILLIGSASARSDGTVYPDGQFSSISVGQNAKWFFNGISVAFRIGDISYGEFFSVIKNDTDGGIVATLGNRHIKELVITSKLFLTNIEVKKAKKDYYACIDKDTMEVFASKTPCR